MTFLLYIIAPRHIPCISIRTSNILIHSLIQSFENDHMALALNKAMLFVILVLCLVISPAWSAQLLDEEAAGTTPPVVPSRTAAATAAAVVPGGVDTAAAVVSSGTAPATAPAVVPGGADTAAAVVPSGTTGATAPAVVPGGAAVAPGSTGTTVPAGGGSATAVNPGVGADDHLLTFFMHDILGGSRPSALAVTGIVSNPAVSGKVPFAKPNGAVINADNGIPTNNANGGIINNNNVPFLTGLSGFPSGLVSGQTGNNNNNNIIGGIPGFPVLNSADFPSGTTLQKLMFGTMTVFDDEVTEGHELGSGLVGRAQGFYIASSEDGNSQTMAFTVMFKSSSYADSLSLFGVHRTRTAESHLAIMGGTGKYVNAKGFAMVKTLPLGTNVHPETDGAETILEITVYLAY